MALKEEYDSQDDIPEAHRELFEEKGGKFVFTAIPTLLRSAGQAQLRDEAKKYRTQLRELETATEGWKALGDSPESVREALDRIPVLEAQVKDGTDEEKVNQLVAAKVAQVEGRLGRELKGAQGELEKASKAVQAYEAQARQAAIKEAAVKAATEGKVGKIRPGALEDMLFFAQAQLETVEERDESTGALVIKSVVAKDGVGVTPGLEAPAWFSEIAERKLHWFEDSSGGGAPGSGKGGGVPGGNPWAAGNWDVTAQGRYVREHGAEKAAQMAKAAGSFLGSPRPKVA